jgi:hypothetical protein
VNDDSNLYFSLDVEANGPIPGSNSLLSFGLAAFTLDGPVRRTGERPTTFGANLEMLHSSVGDSETMEWWNKHPEAYAQTRVDPEFPGPAIKRAVTWIEEWCRELNAKPTCVCFPAAYDFMWWHWYALRFAEADPFGFKAFDIRTAASVVLGLPYEEASSKKYPRHWWPDGTQLRRGHSAVDDAIEQGHMFVGVMRQAQEQREGVRVALGIAKAALAGSYKDRVPMLQDLVQTLHRIGRQD